jgi:hypothetical protein
VDAYEQIRTDFKRVSSLLRGSLNNIFLKRDFLCLAKAKLKNRTQNHLDQSNYIIEQRKLDWLP